MEWRSWELIYGTTLVSLRTFGYNRPILVVLVQWQHLMISFIHCFARRSKIYHRIDLNPTEELTIKKNFKFSTSEFTKIRHFETTKQKKFPLPNSIPQWKGDEHPSTHPTPFGASSPNFELALTPLHDPYNYLRPARVLYRVGQKK